MNRDGTGFLDLLISTLREHEKALDEAVNKLQTLVSEVQSDSREARYKYEIYGSLIYIGTDAEHNVHLMLKKQSKYFLPKVIRETKKAFENKEVRVTIEELI